MKTYHEKVAEALVNTRTVGSMNTYEQILAALLKKEPDEEKLKVIVSREEAKASLALFGKKDSGYRFVKE